ncbi:Cullin-domain-containing protein [Polychaeton citri CBS 116435]|uniref:Cullin-domain-containing protein n=1 Tax=Polychaeton citri CBS 116435 TaxID=1314669 RepID=A0A9P4Q5M8_9PEZI|nr:Cullin-domain-containing protein [Polychaeton citri CBS 116435]
MYSFTSSRSVTNGEPIDLTSSPASSSQQRRPINGGLRVGAGRNGFNPHAGAKRLVVKNLKASSSWDGKAYQEQMWGKLDEALARVFKDANGELGSGISKEELYRGVENVCRQGGARAFFERLDQRCRQHVQQNVLQLVLQSSDNDNVQTLEHVLTEWSQWKKQMATLKAIFFFLDRSYLLSSSKPTLSELTPQLFREVIFADTALKDKVINGACDLTAAQRRCASPLDSSTFQNAVDMFHGLGIYTSVFEPCFLGASQEWAASLADETASSKDVPEFVALANDTITREMMQCEKFALDASTKRDLLALLEDHFVQRKESYLTGQDALADLLDQSAISDLGALYSLLNRRRLGGKLRLPFEKWVDLTGTSIVFAKETDSMVVRLLSLKRRLDLTWKTAFQRDASLGHGLRESFATFINKTKKGDSTWGTDNTKVGEMIAKYVDQLLRGGVKAIPEMLTARRASIISQPLHGEAAQRQISISGTSFHEPGITTTSNQQKENSGAAEIVDDNEDPEVDEDEEVNIQLDQVLDLFRFLEGKAVFEAFYKKDLARRLLMGRSASNDAERSMLARLKTECGSNFTQNLEQMFKDIELAREEMSAYKQWVEERLEEDNKRKTLDLDVKILSSAAWPTYPDIPVRIPTEVQRAISRYETHYKHKHSGRKLDWKHALAHCQLKASFKSASTGRASAKELVVSSFQAVVLLLFNGLSADERLSYQHIMTETGLPEHEVKRTLQSLACAKLRPLTKHPKGREISETDTFSVNEQFEHPKHRVKINQVQLKETKEENKETHERVAEDRNFECQAAIVRIMKSRKLISHPELVSEVIEATRRRGVMGVADIKKNIDRLIEKDYMERDEGNKYCYVA